MTHRLLITTAALSLSMPALAAEGVDGNPMKIVTLEMLWGVVLFIAFAAALGLKVWPRILGALQAREQKLEGDLLGAESARVEHEKLVQEYKAKLADAQKEYQKVVDDARQDAQRVAASLKADAEKEIASLKARAEADITAAKDQALSEIYGQAAELSTQIAGKILAREVSASDHEALIKESLAQLA